MYRFILNYRAYCKLASKSELIKPVSKQEKTSKIDFFQIKHTSKVPAEPVIQQTESVQTEEDLEIDPKTIQLLERLSLVDLDSKAALETLKSSIQFANKIANINTDNIAPLYSVLENENLKLREDSVAEGNCRDKILQNAKITDEDYFVSPPGNIPLEQDEKKFEVK